ncbi:MAG TPA: C4-dicarboxylate ABC transporter permease, partial [Pusillimonas sp.]|nr:C4-dicarboxylate ABC transporter permease [Pusillimonas sp.]
MTGNLAVGIGCSLALLVLIALRIPIAVAMMLTAVTGIYLVQGAFAAWFQLAGASINVTIYGLSVIPLFILMGNLAAYAGLSRDLFLLASRWVGRMPGGLCISTILACAGFSTLSGSSLATAATIGRISMGEMLKRGYSPSISSGTIAAGGTIGILIPPSVMLVVYG